MNSVPLRILVEVAGLLSDIRKLRPDEALPASLWLQVAQASGSLGYHVNKIADSVSVEVKATA